MIMLALIMAAAAAETSGDGIVAKGTLVVGSGVVSSILTWLAAKKHAEKTAVPQPCMTEQTGYQATMKKNDKDHTDIFMRLRVLEAEVAGIKATITAKFDGLSAQLMETREMVRSLYDKVCNGGKRK